MITKKLLIISGNPKEEGLCRSIEGAVAAGASDAGAEVTRLNVSGTLCCRVCGSGWGICRAEHRCAFGDDGFGVMSEKVKEADGFALISPVYFGETAEGLKSFFDRMRRCHFGASGAMSGKKVLLCASAGGSGGGILSTLAQMERFCGHMGASVFDYVGINRWNAEYKREAARQAGKMIIDN